MPWDALPNSWFGLAGMIIAFLGYPWVQMARGKWVPIKFLEMADQRTENWRTAHNDLSKTTAEYAEQTKELLAHAETSLVLLRSITDRVES